MKGEMQVMGDIVQPVGAFDSWKPGVHSLTRSSGTKRGRHSQRQPVEALTRK